MTVTFDPLVEIINSDSEGTNDGRKILSRRNSTSLTEEVQWQCMHCVMLPTDRSEFGFSHSA